MGTKLKYVGFYDPGEDAETGQVVRRGETYEVDTDRVDALVESGNWARPTAREAKSVRRSKTPEPVENTVGDTGELPEGLTEESLAAAGSPGAVLPDDEEK